MKVRKSRRSVELRPIRYVTGWEKLMRMGYIEECPDLGMIAQFRSGDHCIQITNDGQVFFWYCSEAAFPSKDEVLAVAQLIEERKL